MDSEARTASRPEPAGAAKPSGPQRRIAPRPKLPDVLAALVRDCSNPAHAATLLCEQFRLRTTINNRNPTPDVAASVQRLQPVWSAYLTLYGQQAMHELVLQPLFSGDPDTLRSIVNIVPRSRRLLLAEQLGL